MRKLFLGILAFFLTLFIAVYQRITGPTYPQKTKVVIQNKEYVLKFIRSHGGDTDAEMKFYLPPEVQPYIYYKRYPTKDTFTVIKLTGQDSVFIAKLPHQPPAGKLLYYLLIEDNRGNILYSNEKQPVIIRFKGAVPSYVLIPHIIFMFLALFFSILAGLYAGFNTGNFRVWTFITFFTLLIGGMILGPFVQKYAFGEFWTGVPFGWDLTDNKTLIAFTGWLMAVITNLKKPRRGWVIFAVVLQLFVYLIPHSLYGSQLDYETGKTIQGMIFSFLSVL